MFVMDGENSAIPANRRKIPMRVSSQTETRQGVFAFALALPMALAMAATTILGAGMLA